MKKLFVFLSVLVLLLINLLLVFRTKAIDLRSANGNTAVYLPVVVRPQATPTPTATPTASPTPTFSPTPTITPTPTFSPTPTITPTPTFSPTPTITPTPTSPPPSDTGLVVITDIYFNGTGSQEPDEYVQIRNDDGRAIYLANWTLRDSANHIFTFPTYVIQPGQTCRIYTNQNHPQWCNFNYGSSSAIWNNSGDCAYLRNAASTLIDTYCY